MILRMSSLFVRTLRDDPADAEVPSHRLLVRAGYIRRAAPGIYTWLPLGLRTLRKVENLDVNALPALCFLRAVTVLYSSLWGRWRRPPAGRLCV